MLLEVWQEDYEQGRGEGALGSWWLRCVFDLGALTQMCSAELHT